MILMNCAAWEAVAGAYWCYSHTSLHVCPFHIVPTGRGRGCHPVPDGSFVPVWISARGIDEPSSYWAPTHGHSGHFRFEMVKKSSLAIVTIDVTISFLPVDSLECSQVPRAGVRADCAGNGSCHRRAAALHAVRQSGEKCGIRRNTSSDSLLIFLGTWLMLVYRTSMWSFWQDAWLLNTVYTSASETQTVLFWLKAACSTTMISLNVPFPSK